jgi:glycosyltransferase involved in cell wall biosynthesis
VHKKLILFVHQASEMYGSDKVLLFLAHGLQVSTNFRPIVVIPDEGPLYGALLAVGVEVHIGDVAKISRAVFSPTGIVRLIWQSCKAMRFLNRVVAGRAVAAVHSNTLAVLSGALWAKVRCVPHVWHVHEIILSPRIVSKVFPFLVRLFADRVISNSTLTERWLLAEQPSLSAKSSVIFNGLPSVCKPSPEAIQLFRKKVNAADGDVVLTIAGRINRWKGQELLLAAVTELNHRGRAGALRLAIVGGAAPGLEDLPTALISQAEDGGFGQRCTLMPFVDDIWPVWFGSDIAVVPSTEPEPFGMVAIEAMAAGIPVIAAAHGGLLDIVVDEVTGLLFEPRSVLALANAIDRLVINVQLRRQLGEEGAKRQRDLFSVLSQVQKTAAIYDELSNA